MRPVCGSERNPWSITGLGQKLLRGKMENDSSRHISSHPSSFPPQKIKSEKCPNNNSEYPLTISYDTSNPENHNFFPHEVLLPPSIIIAARIIILVDNDHRIPSPHVVIGIRIPSYDGVDHRQSHRWSTTRRSYAAEHDVIVFVRGPVRGWRGSGRRQGGGPRKRR